MASRTADNTPVVFGGALYDVYKANDYQFYWYDDSGQCPGGFKGWRSNVSGDTLVTVIRRPNATAVIKGE